MTCCYWCSEIITGKICQCPMRYNPPQISVKHTNDTTGSFFFIKENMTESKNMVGTYDCVGYFCCNACCLAYIKSHKVYDSAYDVSYLLIKRYYNGDSSPDWRKMEKFGGDIPTQQFYPKKCVF